MLNKVTITGADDSIKPVNLVDLSQEYPFVEWGLLLSRSNEGNPRFPSRGWLRELVHKETFHGVPMQLSAHVCGGWCRDIVLNNLFTIIQDRPEYMAMFQRVQLNFSPYDASRSFVETLKEHYPHKQWIFQVGQKNRDDLLRYAHSQGVNVACLFDRSGGKGKLPRTWPQPVDGIYAGYAGGLGPDTLEEQIPKILEAAGGKPFWIDMESRVRSNDDKYFDLDKVRTCLEIAKKWVE